MAISSEIRAQALVTELSSGRDWWHGGSGDMFGWGLCVVPDVNQDGVADIAVGAQWAGAVTGRVHVFSGLTFAPLYELNGTAPGSLFGRSIAGLDDINGDGCGDLAVGAPWHDLGPGMGDAGRVTVFSGKDGTPIRMHDAEGVSAFFGGRVTDAGDLDLDGVEDYLISAQFQDTSPTTPLAGRVYAYSGSTGAFLFSLDGIRSHQEFGDALASTDDVDGDLVPDFMVTSRDPAITGGSGRGRVDVYSGATQSLLFAFVGQRPHDAQFGSALAGSADFNADAIPDFVICDSSCTRNGSLAGAAYIYSGATGALVYAWDGSPSDLLGIAASTIRDANGDGFADLAFGAGQYPNSSAYLYSGTNGRLLYTFQSTISGDFFGFPVCDLGDLTNDGLSELVVGAHKDDQNAVDAGRIYVFSGNDLYLQALPRELSSGDLVTVATRCRSPFALTALFVVAVSGAPTSILIDIGLSDAFGERVLGSVVPPGLAGIELALQAFATDPLSGVAASSLETLTFN